ncbi:methyltransferase domain-containing protein [Magnetococcales bacterium HHB-1]
MSQQNSSPSEGSYRLGEFQESEEELTRLKAQARLALALEEKVLRQAGLTQGMRALDVGCGPGITSCLMAKVVGDGGHVTGVDFDPRMIQNANQEAEKQRLDNISFEEGSIYNLTLEKKQADFVYSRFVFQHLDQPEQALQQLMKVVKPGGVVCLIDVDDDWLTFYPEPEGFKKLMRATQAVQREAGGDRFVGRKLGPYLAQAGFSQVRVIPVTFTSGDIGMDALVGLNIDPRIEYVEASQEEEAKQWIQSVQALIKQPEAWGYATYFMAVGVAPS